MSLPVFTPKACYRTLTAAVKTTLPPNRASICPVMKRAKNIDISKRNSHGKRWLSVKLSPGNDPLELLKQSSEKRNLCDDEGYRKRDQHWTFGIATSGATVDKAPFLRTIDFQRVSPSGIDFIRKRGKSATLATSYNVASTLLCSFGKYKPGYHVEQWVAEGMCEPVVLSDELLHVIPPRTVVEIVASGVVKEEEGKAADEERTLMDKHSHFMELVQRTRQKLDAGQLTREEIDQAIMAIRFVPYRMERLIGGPDQVMWERWQWQRDPGECPEGTALWKDPQHLLPY